MFFRASFGKKQKLVCLYVHMDDVCMHVYRWKGIPFCIHPPTPLSSTPPLLCRCYTIPNLPCGDYCNRMTFVIVTTPLFLMRQASSKRDCLSVRLSVCMYVCPYVTLFYIFAKCTLVTSSCISCRITQPCGLVYLRSSQISS